LEGARSHVRARYGGLAGGFERAVVAGADLLLYASPVPERIVTQGEGEPMIAVDVIQTIIDTLERVVDRSRIEEKIEETARRHEGLRNLLRILDDSEERIDGIRKRAGGPLATEKPASSGNVINLRDYAVAPAVYKTAAQKSIALVRDPSAFIPAGPGRKCAALPVVVYPSASLKRQEVASFADALCRNFSGWEVLPPLVGFDREGEGEARPLFEQPRKTVIDAALFDPRTRPGRVDLELRKGQLLLPVVSFRGAPAERFLEDLAEFIDRHGAPFVVVTGSPIIDWIPPAVGCLLTFGASAQVAAATTAVLAGTAVAEGALDRVI
jgi:hypothetical protein